MCGAGQAARHRCSGILYAEGALLLHVPRTNPVPNNSPGIGSGWASSWPVSTGNDFLPNHMAPGIDYGSIHLWPDNWKRVRARA